MRATQRRAAFSLLAITLASATACGTSSRSEREGRSNAEDRRTPDAQGRPANNMHVNLTGCVQRASDGRYVLANVNSAGAETDQSRRAAGARDTVGTTGAFAAGDQYVLADMGKSDLSRYVGHRVRISGRFGSAPLPSGTGQGAVGTSGAHGNAGRSGATAANPRAAGGAGEERQLEVDSVHQLTGTCGS
jgi:hypothetical protein